MFLVVAAEGKRGRARRRTEREKGEELCSVVDVAPQPRRRAVRSHCRRLEPRRRLCSSPSRVHRTPSLEPERRCNHRLSSLYLLGGVRVRKGRRWRWIPPLLLLLLSVFPSL
ncbi:uncharacterized protein LOC127746476 [Arachis duranensis]|uniref:Uncharacterized protein LOC127746476 n=1 Tax=Arachis duranensis TaxID=130453 RepID=A0A9C6WUK7_ARADU|nr:uncharacterized protein LOC127746476 [Arachis duranensis]